MLRLLPLCVLLMVSGCAGGSRYAYGPGRTDYPQPGPRGDPWRPYIREAGARFSVPQRWIRVVMQRESGGQEYRYGRPIRSQAGAMGLMQLMPATYADMQVQNGLGGDPYEPRDNILAGTAYIRLMYARYGAPGFLAAYNAGPQRVDDYVAAGRPLPNETADYVAALAPDLGSGTPAVADPVVAAPVRLASYRVPARGSCVQDPNAAYDPDAVCAPGMWAVQVGAFATPGEAHFAATMAREAEPGLLAASQSLVQPTSRFGGAVLYRARLAGLERAAAGAVCEALPLHGMACMIVGPGG